MKLQLELDGRETPAQVDQAHKAIDTFCGRTTSPAPAPSSTTSPPAKKPKRPRRTTTAHIMPTAEERAQLQDTDRRAARELVDDRGIRQ